MSGRDCSFASQGSNEKNISTPGTSSYEGSISPGGSQSQVSSSPAPTTSSYQASLSELPRISINIYRDTGSLDEALNVNHMELFIHLMIDKDIYYLGITTEEHHEAGMAMALKTSLESPYLLHQILAFSARHLAFLHPDRSGHYLHQAISLQTRAVSLFNATWTESEVDHSNCVAVLLFSATLGHHILADTLAKRDPGGLDSFLIHCIQCLETQRGIYTVASSVWPLLMKTELADILSWSSGFTSREPRANHCQQAIELVDAADGLDDEDKEACRQAIDYLQLGFDAVTAEPGQHEGNRHQMIFLWTMLVPLKYVRLLAVKRPEALVILAYYTVLLHYGRHIWQVVDAGKYIFSLLVNFLPSDSHRWLEVPRELIAKDLQ